MPKHEKRVLRLFQSDLYGVGVSNGRGLKFSQIYTSELFADSNSNNNSSNNSNGSDGTMNPSLVAEVRCPAHLDCQLNLQMYYSSSLTGNREILLASATFSKSDIDNDNNNNNNNSSSSFTATMTSEFGGEGIAVLDLLNPLFSCCNFDTKVITTTTIIITTTISTKIL